MQNEEGQNMDLYIPRKSNRRKKAKITSSDHIPVDRRAADVRILSMHYNVKNISECEFVVSFPGPIESIYSRGVWQVEVTLHQNYPLVAPDIKFLNKIIHPNINYNSGILSQILVNNVWNPPTSDLMFIFKELLVELLCKDPREVIPYDNQEAADMYHNNGFKFVRTVEAACLNQANIPSNLTRKQQ